MLVRKRICVVTMLLLMFPGGAYAQTSMEVGVGYELRIATQKALKQLLERHGTEHEARIKTGVRQAAQLWRTSDGSTEDFVDFVNAYFIVDPVELADTFQHLEYSLEMLDGHLSSLGRELRHYMDEDVGPIRAVDRLLGAYDPAAHLSEDLFQSRIGFVALLNYTGSSLEQRLQAGPQWSRERWAEARLVGRFKDRIPASAQQKLSTATAKADAYISDYNMYLHHWLTDDGRRLFPQGLRLISHWGLRDELKSQYASEAGFEKQEMIAQVMDHIVRQTIPSSVINNTGVDWKPKGNTVQLVEVSNGKTTSTDLVAADSNREPDSRYLHLLEVFKAMRAVDYFTPDTPSAIQRAFESQREIPVAQVKQLFVGLFETPTAKHVADLIASRLGRDLEPFDIWYAGFKPRVEFDEALLNKMTQSRYPTAAAFERDIPRILQQLGFSPATTKMLTAHITVDPSRGAGHAMGAQRRDDKAHLRTRVGADGMDYKGYNIAIHELGHNVEQVFSLNTIDHTLLAGVPANAFTEALAFVFQSRDLELLGLTNDNPLDSHLKALEAFWNTCEIGAVTLVDIGVWEWMYAHPGATPAELQEATVNIAQETWDRTFGTLMQGTSSTLLGIYSHMLAYPLYLANYPIGHLIAFALEEHFAKSDLAAEFERVCQLGRLTPDLWLQRAVGSSLSVGPLVRRAEISVMALQER